MSADERLVVMLEARISEFEKRMRQAEGTGTRTYTGLRRNSRSATRQMEADMTRSAGRINQALAGVSSQFGLLKRAFAGVAVAAGVRSFTTLADAATKMRNALRVAGLEGEALNKVYGQLYQSAQRNAAPIGSLVDLYSKLALTQNELGVTSDELIQFTDGIAVALKVAGTDATAASGSLLQLSQALGGGIVRAEEFNSILEGTPTIAQAVARGLKEANGSVAELRKLVVDGQVSSTAFFRAFEVGSVELRQQAETSQATVGQAFTRLGNSVVTVVGKFDEATGASSHFADMIGDVADGVDQFDASAFVAKLQSIAQAFADAEDAGRSWLNAIGNAEFFAAWNEFTGATEGGQFVNPDIREAEAKIEVLEREIGTLQAQIENNTELGFDNTDAIARLQEVRAELAALRAEAAGIARYVTDLRTGAPVEGPAPTTTGEFYDGSGYEPPPSAPQPVSIADHPATPTKPKSGGGGGRKGRGGSGRGRGANRQDARIESLVSSLQTEKEVLQAWYDESQALLNVATDKQLEAIGGRHAAIERMEAEHKERLREIDDESLGARLGLTADYFGELYDLSGSSFDGLLRVQRTFAAASALINTWQGYTAALASNVPMTPWARMAWAGKILAAGMGAVSAIKGSGGGSGGGGGGGSAGGSSSKVDKPEAAPARPQAVTIDMRGKGRFTADEVEDMINQLQKQNKNGVKITVVRE